MDIPITLTQHQLIVAANAVQVQAEAADRMAKDVTEAELGEEFAQQYKTVALSHWALSNKLRQASLDADNQSEAWQDDLCDPGRPGGGR